MYACENPTVVVAAATRLGAAGAPLVCLGGPPATAARMLLGRLVAAGAHLAYHGDVDRGGIRIGNLVVRRHGAAARRFSSADDRAARGGRELHGTPVAAARDPSLEGAMLEAGRAAHEEQVLDRLLGDLEAEAKERPL